MANRLFVDIKEDCNGNLTGPVKFPADGTFTIEALLTVIEEFSKSLGRAASEVLADMYYHQRWRENTNSNSQTKEVK